mgnify:CR=1 FL=1
MKIDSLGRPNYGRTPLDMTWHKFGDRLVLDRKGKLFTVYHKCGRISKLHSSTLYRGHHCPCERHEK